MNLEESIREYIESRDCFCDMLRHTVNRFNELNALSDTFDVVTFAVRRYSVEQTRNPPETVIRELSQSARIKIARDFIKERRRPRINTGM